MNTRRIAIFAFALLLLMVGMASAIKARKQSPYGKVEINFVKSMAFANSMPSSMVLYEDSRIDEAAFPAGYFTGCRVKQFRNRRTLLNDVVAYCHEHASEGVLEVYVVASSATDPVHSTDSWIVKDLSYNTICYGDFDTKEEPWMASTTF